VNDALDKLDTLTREESLMTVARNLKVTCDIDDNMKAVKDSGQTFLTVFVHVLTNFATTFQIATDELKRLLTPWGYSQLSTLSTLTGNQSRENLRRWLEPPDPSINHNIACDLQHDGTATWLIQGSIFEEWKTNGSLLWIRGNRTHLLRSVSP
jgi:hypothetical protein